MTDSSSTRLRAILEQIRQDADVPGITVAVARGDQRVELTCVGADAKGRSLEPDSLFPVASITKLATALAVLRLVDQGQLSLDDPLSIHLPDAAAAQPAVTVRRLLCHTSGLPGEFPDEWAPYGPGTDWPALAQAALRTVPEVPPGTRVGYSGVGYLLLGLLVERRTGVPIADAFHQLVFAPLRMDACFGAEPPRAPVVIADVAGPEQGTELEPFNSAYWRSVPDPTAGLLTTASGVTTLASAFQGTPHAFLRPETSREATRDQTGGRPGGLFGPLKWDQCPWGLGPMLHNPAPPSFTPALGGPGSFGHTGYSTGYVWVTPNDDVTWAVLGARTYDNGWPITHGPIIESAVLAQSREE